MGEGCQVFGGGVRITKTALQQVFRIYDMVSNLTDLDESRRSPLLPQKASLPMLGHASFTSREAQVSRLSHNNCHSN